MKFFLNAILAIIILSAGLFGLHKTGIITFNTPDDSVLNGTIEGTISDIPTEENVGNNDTQEMTNDTTETIKKEEMSYLSTPDDSVLNGTIEGTISDIPTEENVGNNDTQEMTNDTTETIKKEEMSYLSTPYPDTAEIGTFTELGKTSVNTTLYSYKVKLGGTIGGVENKWEEFAKGNSLNGKITYTNGNGNTLSTDVRLNAGEIVYVELSITSAQITETPGTTTASVGSNETTVIKAKPSQAKTCIKYVEFFECVLDKVSGVDPDIMRNNLNAYLQSISSLTVNEQEAKCTNLIYEIKSKSTSTANQACIDIIK